MKMKTLGRHGAAILVAMTLLTSLAAAQMPEEIAEKLRDMGTAINPPATAGIYKPLHQTGPYDGVKVTRDLRYGEADRHRLDVFRPEKEGGGRPVLVFVHGGGFVGGDKHTPGSPFYDNVPVMAAQNGLVGVNITYRLAPDHQWPAGAEDVAGAIRWVKENIAAHGGDRDKVFLMGHSAGAVHAASYAAFPRFHGEAGHGLSGLLLISGLYDFTAMTPPRQPEQAYFGDMAGTADVSSLEGLTKLDLPILVAHAELDPPTFVNQATLLTKALCEADKCPTAVNLIAHNHISEVYAINTDDQSLSAPILDFIKSR